MAKTKSAEPTHLFMTDVIVSGMGLCKAGTKACERDMEECAWQHLTSQKLLRPIAEVEEELAAASATKEPDAAAADKAAADKAAADKAAADKAAK